MRNDLISRETAIAEITSWIFTDEDLEGEGDEYQYFNRGLKRAIKALAKVPAVDAVEVVRCKDCLHWIDGVCGNFSNEDGSDYYTPAHGYCYAAEKEDDDDETD